MRLQFVDPDSLDAHTRVELVRELYALHSQIFDGVSIAEFRARVFDGAGAVRTRIVIGRADDEAVAYSAVHVFETELEGARVPIVRAEAGALPNYRGGLFMARLWARELLRALVLYGRAPWYVGTLVHPSAYVALARLVDVVPRPGDSLAVSLLEQLETACALRVEGLPRGLAHVGWVVNESEEQSARWRVRKDLLTRYFLAANPDYRKGVGLVTVHRFTLRSLVRGVWRAKVRGR